jgi:hypothetical protein
VRRRFAAAGVTLTQDLRNEEQDAEQQRRQHLVPESAMFCFSILEREKRTSPTGLARTGRAIEAAGFPLCLGLSAAGC